MELGSYRYLLSHTQEGSYKCTIRRYHPGTTPSVETTESVGSRRRSQYEPLVSDRQPEETAVGGQSVLHRGGDLGDQEIGGKDGPQLGSASAKVRGTLV